MDEMAHSAANEPEIDHGPKWHKEMHRLWKAQAPINLHDVTRGTTSHELVAKYGVGSEFWEKLWLWLDLGRLRCFLRRVVQSPIRAGPFDQKHPYLGRRKTRYKSCVCNLHNDRNREAFWAR